MPIPEQIVPAKLADYLEIMTRAVFQAGVTWAQIDRTWDEYRAAFESFEPRVVAQWGEGDIERLMQFPGIMHSRKKIAATIKNAKTILELDEQYGGFQNYLHSKSGYEELGKNMKKRFSFMGELNVYYFLFRIKEPVPEFEEWVKTIEGHHPRMREMVEAARKTSDRS